MAFDDRLQSLLLGVAIGFVLGYLVRLVQGIQKGVADVKEELDEVDEIVKRIDHDTSESSHINSDEVEPIRQNEKGFMTTRWGANIAAILVVGLAFYASIVSQNASNDVQDSQDRSSQVVTCNKKVLSEVLIALDERSTYTSELAAANIDLQQAQYDFFTLLAHKPPYSEERRMRAFLVYVDAQRVFLDLAEKSRAKVETHPFPTIEDFSTCLENN